MTDYRRGLASSVFPAVVLGTVLLGTIQPVRAGTIHDLNTGPTVVRTGTFPGTPVGVAPNAVGDIFVLTEERQIHSLSGVLAVLTSVTLPGTATPVAITATDDGDVYVAMDNGTIHRLNTGLAILATTTITGTPVDLAVEPGTGLVFIATSSGRIFKRAVALGALADNTVTGTPTTIDVNNVGDIFVGTSSGTIHRLNAGLTTLNSGTFAGSAVGIASDTAGHTIVATSSGLRSITPTITSLATASLTSPLVGVDLNEAGDVVTANSAGAVTVLNTGLTAPSTVATGLSSTVDVAIMNGNIYVVGGTAATALPVLSVSTTSLAFGDVTFSTTATPRTFSVSSAGPGSATVTVTSSSASFPITSPSPATFTLDSGMSRTITVGFNAPAALGPVSSTITVGFTSGGTPGTPLTVSATGRSVGRRLCLTGTPISFGIVNRGASAARTFDIQNCGNLTLTMSDVSLSTTAPAGVWSATPLVPPSSTFTLAPTAVRTVTITFAVPATLTTDTTFAAAIRVTSDANSGAPIQTANASGTGHVPVARIHIAPEYFDIDYRNVEIGFRYRKPLIIENSGDLALTFDVTYVDDTNRTDFVLDTDPQSFTIPAATPPMRTSRTFIQAFRPQTAGAKQVILRVGNTNDPAFTSQNIRLHGVGTPPIPIDTVLLLDRSGSMSEPAGEIVKIEALRRASILFTELLRDSVDYLGLTKYDHENANILDLGRIDTVRTAAQGLLNATSDPAGLQPRGSTGIGGAMRRGATQYALSPPVTPPDPAHKKVMVVLTDGVENEHPFIREVLDGDSSNPPFFTANPNLLTYSVGLGQSTNVNAARLQEITNRGSGGLHQVTGNLEGLSLFNLENFYFKVFADAIGQTLVVDPAYSLALGDTLEVPIGIITEDREALFFFIGELPENAYVFELVDPNGVIITTSSTVGGLSVQIKEINNWILFRVKFPDPDVTRSYVGMWRFRIRIQHPERWTQQLLAQTPSMPGRHRASFAASVGSDYKLAASVGPGIVLTGGTIRMRAALTEGGWPSPGALVRVTIQRPGGGTASRDLFDDGGHGDDQPGDGIFGGTYEDTSLEGTYGFLFHSDGRTERGEAVSREAFRSQYVGAPKPDPVDPHQPPPSRKGRSVGFFGGGLLFQDDLPIDSELAFGFRYGRALSRRVGVEGEIILSSPVADNGQHGFWTQLNVLAKVALGPSAAIDPFVTGGIGWVELRNFGAPIDRDGLVPFLGLGLDFHLRPRLDARLEARYFDTARLDFEPSRQLSVFWGVDIDF